MGQHQWAWGSSGLTDNEGRRRMPGVRPDERDRMSESRAINQRYRVLNQDRLQSREHRRRDDHGQQGVRALHTHLASSSQPTWNKRNTVDEMK
jgi:hypothetical protein